MPEAVIGAKPRDIVHQAKTREGSLTVSYNTRDIIANTVGHVLAIPTTHTLLWTWNSAFKNPTRELAGQLFERYKDVPWKGDVLVRVGHVNLFGDLQRIFAKNEDVRGRPWMLKDRVGRGIEFVGKLGAAIITTWEAFKAKFFRSDYYNVFANTAVVFHPKLAPGMHELGHAEFYNQIDRTKRAAYQAALLNQYVYIPFLKSAVEYKATENAMRHYKNDAERRAALKIHEAAWATYLGRDALMTLATVAPALAVPLLNAAIGVYAKVAIGSRMWAASAAFALHPYGSSIAGHLMNRLYPKKDERFGYIFEGQPSRKATADKEPARELKPHQVLVATAKPQEGITEHSTRQYASGGDRNGKRPLHSNTHRITF